MTPMPGMLTRGRLLAGGAIAAVAIAIGAGLVVLGPPSDVRARRLDAQRVDDLRQWARAIDDYWDANDQLPATLADVRRQEAWASLREHDPATREPYRYAVTGAVTYELCAVFERASDDERASLWNHGAGLTCFALEARAGR